MSGFKKLAAFVAAQKERIGILGFGWVFDYANNWAFEYVLYPIVIGYYGLVLGGGIMIALSVLMSVVMLVVYDKLKVDWLGIEAVKSLRDEGHTSKWAKLASWLMKKGDAVALIGLSIISEPVKVTLYMRHGSGKFNGFSKRDKLIFFASVIIGNVSWALAVYGGISAIKEAIKFLK